MATYDEWLAEHDLEPIEKFGWVASKHPRGPHGRFGEVGHFAAEHRRALGVAAATVAVGAVGYAANEQRKKALRRQGIIPNRRQREAWLAEMDQFTNQKLIEHSKEPYGQTELDQAFNMWVGDKGAVAMGQRSEAILGKPQKAYGRVRPQVDVGDEAEVVNVAVDRNTKAILHAVADADRPIMNTPSQSVPGTHDLLREPHPDAGQAGRVQTSLYRGIPIRRAHLAEFLADTKPGNYLDFGLVAFSPYENETLDYARDLTYRHKQPHKRGTPKITPVIFTLEPGAKGLLGRAEEVVTQGRFEVVGVERGRLIKVRLRYFGAFDPDTGEIRKAHPFSPPPWSYLLYSPLPRPLRKAAPDLSSGDEKTWWRYVLSGRWQHADAEEFSAHPHITAAVKLLQQFWQTNSTAGGNLQVLQTSLGRLSAGLAAQMKAAGEARLRQVSDALTARAKDAPGSPPLVWTGNLRLSNDLATSIAEAQAGQLVANVSAEVRDTIRRLTTQATMEGWSPYQLADALRRFLPLPPRYQQAVARMESLQIKAGKSPAKARQAARVYAAGLARQRAETVARTEMLSAANKALNEGWRQKVTAGHLPHDTERIWIITRDCKTCPQCREMRGERAIAKLGEPFNTPAGSIMQPPMHPNCRCGQSVFAPGLLTAEEIDDLVNPKVPDPCKRKARRRAP